MGPAGRYPALARLSARQRLRLQPEQQYPAQCRPDVYLRQGAGTGGSGDAASGTAETIRRRRAVAGTRNTATTALRKNHAVLDPAVRLRQRATATTSAA